jgi:hypothetical protein
MKSATLNSSSEYIPLNTSFIVHANWMALHLPILEQAPKAMQIASIPWCWERTNTPLFGTKNDPQMVEQLRFE